MSLLILQNHLADIFTDFREDREGGREREEEGGFFD